MKRIYLLSIAVCISLLFILSGCSSGNRSASTCGQTPKANTVVNENHAPKTVRAGFEGGEALIQLSDNELTKELDDSLPMVLQLQDRSSVMKVATFSPEEFKGREAPGMKPEIGDIALNIRTGEAIVFCRDSQYSPDLVPVGRIISGLDKLFAMQGTFQVYVVQVK